LTISSYIQIFCGVTDLLHTVQGAVIMAMEKRHDPSINIWSDGDGDGELNNTKFSPGSSPSAQDVESVFVYNDLRKGGPQGNGGSKPATTDQPAQTSTNTGNDSVQQHEDGATASTEVTPPPGPMDHVHECTGTECGTRFGPNDIRYNGLRFQCLGKDANHVFCKECASNDVQCPYCEMDVKADEIGKHMRTRNIYK
jgi:uncharacterized Zn-finger protein